MNQHQENIITYALQTYGYLMPFKKPFTLQELARAIEKHYKPDEHIQEIIDTLERVEAELAKVLE